MATPVWDATMNKLQAFESVKQARALTQGVNAQLAESSKKQYRAAFARMQAAGMAPEKMANTANGFYFYRAAWVHHHAAQIRAILNAADIAARSKLEDQWINQVAQLQQHMDALKKYRPDPSSQHLARGLVGDWASALKISDPPVLTES